jgi:hypothetical protein
MPHAPDNTDAERWRDRARKMRNIAQGMHDLASKRAILKTADDFESFANMADASDLLWEPDLPISQSTGTAALLMTQ